MLCYVIEWCVFVLPRTQQTVAVWLLPSLVMVRIWTGGGVRDLALCQTASCHSHCTDRVCLIRETGTSMHTCSRNCAACTFVSCYYGDSLHSVENIPRYTATCVTSYSYIMVAAVLWPLEGQRTEVTMM